MAVDLEAHVRAVPDFPEPGVLFRDLTPLWADAAALDAALTALAARVEELEADFVVAPEARGYVLGAALARELGAGFVLARKPGRLPAATRRVEYSLEYGTDVLEVHADAFPAGARVLVHDDLLATGGTASAVCRLAEESGGEVVACAFLLELTGLGGRDALAPRDVHAVLALPAAG